jgi:hypothetical protein
MKRTEKEKNKETQKYLAIGPHSTLATGISPSVE